MKKSGLALCVALLGASAAWADNESGLYLGGGVGQFNVEVEDVGQDTFDGDDDAFKAFVGWRFNPYLAIEFDAYDFGNPKDDVDGFDVETDISGYAPYVIGTLPLGFLELSAKAGYMFYDYEIKSEGLGGEDEDGNDLVYGVGVGLTLFDHLHARLEYEVFDLDEVEDADAFWLTAAWRF